MLKIALIEMVISQLIFQKKSHAQRAIIESITIEFHSQFSWKQWCPNASRITGRSFNTSIVNISK